MLKRYKFDASKFKLGMRTVKTGLAVFLVILSNYIFGWKGMQIAALTAVFSLREDFDKSMHFGFSRVVGNSIGGVLAIAFFLLSALFGHAFWVTLIFAPVFTMLCIMLNVAIDNKPGIVGSAAALLIIILSIPSGDAFLYVIARVSETFYGVFIATLVNSDVDKLRLWLKAKKEGEKEKK